MEGVSPATFFLYSLVACIAGIALSSFFSFSLFIVYGAGLASMVSAILFVQKKYRISALLVLFFVLGIGRVIISEPQLSQPKHIAFYNGKTITVRGSIVQEPDVRLDHQKIIINVIDTGEKTEKMNGLLLVKTNLYPTYTYGELLEVHCQVAAPEPIEDFSYDKYLARHNIYSVCWRGNITKIEKGKGNVVLAGILSLKGAFMESINGVISEPHAAFLAGLLVGARRGIPQYVLDAFSRTGTTHIIAISGSNITIIAAVVLGFLQFFGIHHRRAFWITSIGIMLFVVMTGASASVVRAGIMGIFVLFARQMGRMSRATNALVFTAWAMLMYNPKLLIFDAGFQLSFLATVGLVYIQPVFVQYTARLPEFFGIKDALNTTLAAMVTTTPLILYQFGRLSIVAPLANILILPAIPLTMAVGFVAGVIGMFWQGIGQLLAWPAWLLLEYMIRVAEILSNLKFASLDFGSFHWVLLVGMYSIIGWCIFRITKYGT